MDKAVKTFIICLITCVNFATPELSINTGQMESNAYISSLNQAEQDEEV
jgi:hypothetical protein